jgi:hypothetical protein
VCWADFESLMFATGKNVMILAAVLGWRRKRIGVGERPVLSFGCDDKDRGVRVHHRTLPGYCSSPMLSCFHCSRATWEFYLWQGFDSHRKVALVFLQIESHSGMWVKRTAMRITRIGGQHQLIMEWKFTHLNELVEEILRELVWSIARIVSRGLQNEWYLNFGYVIIDMWAKEVFTIPAIFCQN